MSATRLLALWCPDWPVTAAGVDGDAVPAAVLHANRVVACSAAARADGVRRGLRKREAQARCPELVLLRHDPDDEARAFEPVVAAVEEAICPRIEVLRPGLLALSARGPSRYFGGDKPLAAQVVAVACSIDGVSTAVAGVADGRLAATIAARRAMVVPPGESRRFLAGEAVDILGQPALGDLLVRLGVRTLGDLANLPPAQVLARFGPEGAAAHRQARGEDPQPLAARTPPPDLAVAAELDPPADRVDRAAFVAKSLADQLHDELARRGLACTRLAIEAETEHGESLTRLWRHDGALTAGAIAERVRWQLDGWLTSRDSAGRPTAGISHVRLVPDEVRPDTGRQGGFWGGATEADLRAARALARVQGMLGFDQVGTAVVGGGRSPAERFRFVPWGDARALDPPTVGGRAAPAAERRPPWPGSVPPPAPALVHSPPRPAEVVDGEGRPIRVSGRGMVSGAPARVSVDGGPWVEVVGWAGPWPVDERWWDATARRRRARFQLAGADGTAHLVTLAASRFTVEATYD